MTQYLTMKTLATFRNFFRQSGHRFIRCFLKQACEWGAGTRGSGASVYLSIIQEAYPNIQSALLDALSSLQVGCSDGALWVLWQSAISRLYDFYDYRGLWQEMYDLLSDGLRETQKRGDTRSEAIFLFYQARTDSNQGQSQQAFRKAEHSLRLFRDIQDEQGTANLEHFHGMLLRREDPQAAYQCFQEALNLSTKFNNTGGQASAIYEIGRLEEEMGNLTKAEHLYRKALAIFQELNLPREQATLLFQLGRLLWDIEYLHNALQIYKSLMDERGCAQALHQLGRLYQRKGDHIQAYSLYHQALQIFKRLGAPRSIRSVTRDLDTLGNGNTR